MILDRIEDPRDALDKARRIELFRFARAHGLKDVVETMPAILMRRILRERGLTNIKIPPRPLGAMNQANPLPPNIPGGVEKVVEMDAEADLMRQYEATKTAPPSKPIRMMDINELRRECQRRGIKMGRRDNLLTLREKLSG